ncbi:MAG: radical SAM protein [Candidatus Hydrogenedentes bacterium]|nr:radical SAM protein [Candidatus Hydrogenedentota bacterium]
MNESIDAIKAKWRYASVLMTYGCTVACEHCCFSCSPERDSQVVDVARAVGYLGEFHKLDRAMHVAGGEPFKHYDRLRAILVEAKRAGVPPHFVESNGSWCVDDELVRERFLELRETGIMWMLISTDNYHLRRIPVERIWRALRIAEDVFGQGTTMGLVSEDDLMSRARTMADEDTWRTHIAGHPPKLLSSAARNLAQYVPNRPLSELKLETGWGIDPSDSCDREWDPLWEIHVDPYGNVQTNCGIILGNADAVPVSELALTWHERNPILGQIAKRGVAAIVDIARAHGFEPKECYPQNCNLCWELRLFLRKRGSEFASLFGPDEVYENRLRACVDES